jgi:hypothetical protein
MSKRATFLYNVKFMTKKYFLQCPIWSRNTHILWIILKSVFKSHTILQVQNWKSFLPHFTEIISRDTHAEILCASTKSSLFVKCQICVQKAAFFKVKFASKSRLFVKCKICIERPLFCTMSNLCEKANFLHNVKFDQETHMQVSK